MLPKLGALNPYNRYTVQAGRLDRMHGHHWLGGRGAAAALKQAVTICRLGACSTGIGQAGPGTH